VLVGLVVFVILAAAWALNPFASAARLTGAASASQSDPGAAGPQTTAAAQLADAVLPTNVSEQVATAQPTLAPVLRAWDTTSVDGIVPDPVLASRLDQALNGVDGHVGVVVKDLGSNRGAVLNGDLELQSASLYKLPVLFTVFDLGVSMSEELTISDEALSYDAGTMELAAGETLSVAEAVERMVTLSDNTSAILLGGRVGASHINSSIAALGMDTTHYSLERMTTSALDMAHFMELVADGRAVSPSASADMEHLLLRQRVNDRLPRLLPDDVQVAHKTGNLPGVVNDAGILFGPNSTVVVAALVSDTTDETSAATAIAQVGQIADAYFENLPEVSDRPTVLPAPQRPIPPVVRESHPPTPTPTPAPARTENQLAASPTATTPSPVATSASPTPVVAVATRPAVVVVPLAVVATPKPTPSPTLAPPPPTATKAPPPPPSATPVPPPPTKAPVKTVAPTATSPAHR
jgi:beta-lactamase class A